jgi:hypothetical protein
VVNAGPVSWEWIPFVWNEAMKPLKIFFGIVFLLILASNIRLISHWNESRGVYDDICYLRQAHLFQRFGWHGLDTNIAFDDDHYLAGKLHEINYPTWNDVNTAPCHVIPANVAKLVLAPPPGTGFVLSLFPEGSQVISLYTLANVIVAGFALAGLWRARRPNSVVLAGVFGALSIYFMINPTKASYSIAPTMVCCALAGFLTAKLFADEDRSRLVLTAVIGLLIGLSGSFRLPNVLLSVGYFLFFGLAFLRWRTRDTFLQGLSFGLAFLVGVLPLLVANAINAGSPFATTYGGVDAVPPTLDTKVLLAYLTDLQFPLIVVACGWTAMMWRFACQSGTRRLALVIAGNLTVNLVFFATHPVFTPYYTMPAIMLSLWTLLFATLQMRDEAPQGQFKGTAVA